MTSQNLEHIRCFLSFSFLMEKRFFLSLKRKQQNYPGNCIFLVTLPKYNLYIYLPAAMVPMFVYPQNSNIKILTSKDDDIRRWAFGKCLYHEGGALMSGTSAL